MTDLIELSATELARSIRAKEVSSAEVIEVHLRRIEAVNPRLNAIVQLSPTALDEARAADAALAAGKVLGPLHYLYTLPFSLTGYPCVVVRAGTSREGMPLGVQIVARPWHDHVALAGARIVETTLGGWRRLRL